MQKEKIAICFSELRKAKKIPIKLIIGEDISNSQYHRFVSNKSDITLDKFLIMLRRINVSMDEFLFLTYDHNDSLQEGMIEIKNAFIKQNNVELEFLSEKYEDLFSKTNLLMYQHLADISECLLKKLMNEDYMTSDSSIERYLLNVETWGHYELVLFNNTFFMFNYQSILVFIKQIPKVIERYREMVKTSNLLITVYSNLIIFFLERKNISYAKIVIRDILEQPITNEMITEKILVRFWSTVLEYFESKDISVLQKNSDILTFLQVIECKDLFNVLSFALGYIKELQLQFTD